MKRNAVLKLITVVFFIFIVILVALLIYVRSTYLGDEKSNNSTNSTDVSVASQTLDVEAVDSTKAALETIDLKLYYFDADDYDNAKEIKIVTVDKELYNKDLAAAINKVLSSTAISIKSAVKSGDLITIDISRETARKFNKGSAGGITNTNTLATTVLNLPEIEKMEVTVEGISGIYADHFSFNGTFTKSSTKNYIFVESKNEGKELEY